MSEIDRAIGFVGEELGRDFVEAVAALDNDAGPAKNSEMFESSS